jgi:hypothetical protein
MPEQPVTVYEPEPDGRRRVTIRGQAAGRAAVLADVIEFLRRAGLEDPDPTDAELVNWRGPGPDWAD